VEKGVQMMNLPHIFSNRQFKGMTIAVVIVILVLVTINIFVIGGDLFVYTFNSSLNSPLAIIIAVSAFSVWHLMSTEKHNRFLWSGMLIGWALWALAETIWAVYSILGQEVPYPSLADFFWVIGYIPMGIGLITRIRTMPARPNRSQNMLILGVSATTILITIFFIFMPILQSFDPQRLIESVLNLVYPLADLFLVIIVWRLFFTYEEGDYGFGWRLLTLGFIFMTVSDFIFIYTDWQGLYYPDMTANVISRLVVDVPYTVSYLLFFTGIYALRILMKEEHPIEPGARIRMVRTYGHILIYTRNDNTVIDASPNFNRFFEAVNVKGKSLAETLTISEQDGHAILEKLRKEGRVVDLPLQIRNRSGALQEIRLSGLAVIDPQNVYLGSNLLLRMRVADSSFDDALHQESRSMARYLLEKSGSNNKAEIGQFLSDYYLSYIKSLLNMAFHEGGTVMSQALLDQLLETAIKHNWQMQFNLQTVLDSTNYSLEVLREALPVLLETAKRFVSDITDPLIVEARMREVSSRFSETVHRDVARYGKAENEMGFADHHKGILDERR
jgi:hypothetical protein